VFGFSSANENAPPLDAVGRSNGHHLDAARVDGEAVMEGWLIEIAMDGAEVGETRSATSQGIQTSASRGRIPAQRNNERSNDSDLGGVRHMLILEI